MLLFVACGDQQQLPTQLIAPRNPQLACQEVTRWILAVSERCNPLHSTYADEFVAAVACDEVVAVTDWQRLYDDCGPAIRGASCREFFQPLPGECHALFVRVE